MIKGVIAGNFDVLHPGYIAMFKEMKENCDCLIILLHTDPSIERPHKLKPILSPDERKEILGGRCRSRMGLNPFVGHRPKFISEGNFRRISTMYHNHTVDNKVKILIVVEPLKVRVGIEVQFVQLV